MKSKVVRTIAMLVCVVVGIAMWVWYDIHTKPANPRISDGVRRIIKEEPSLKPMYDEAMSDGLLTLGEANAILNEANELKGSR